MSVYLVGGFVCLRACLCVHLCACLLLLLLLLFVVVVCLRSVFSVTEHTRVRQYNAMYK